jgi:hypothetical protein
VRNAIFLANHAQLLAQLDVQAALIHQIEIIARRIKLAIVKVYKKLEDNEIIIFV